MKKALFLLMAVLICTPVFARDILIKDVPDGIQEQQGQEWKNDPTILFADAKRVVLVT